jgi:16S rRNA (uracil1498-N3)-methyltransferase
MTGAGAAPAYVADEVGVAAHLIDARQLDDSLTIAGVDGHHMQRVRRLRAGEQLTVADGAGRWRRYSIVASARGRLVLEAEGDEVVEPVPAPLCVAPAIVRDTKLDATVAQLTELGVTEVAPVLVDRSGLHLDGAARDRVAERCRISARVAAMQCRRAHLPVVQAPGDLATLTGRPDLLVAARGGIAPRQLPAPGPAGFTVATGPEGGFTAPEQSALVAAGARPIALGRYVLRARHAPLAAAAVLLARQYV